MHTAYSEDISGISLQKLLSKKAKCHSEMKFRHAAQVNLFARARCNLSIFVDSEAKKRSTLSITSCLSRDRSRGAENLDRILHPVCNDPCRATVFQGQSSIPRPHQDRKILHNQFYGCPNPKKNRLKRCRSFDSDHLLLVKQGGKTNSI